MHLSNYILKSNNIKEEYIKEIEEIDEKTVYLHIQLPQTPHICPNCNNLTNKIKDYRCRKILFHSNSDANYYMLYNQRRYQCKHCKKAFSENATFARRYQRHTLPIIELIFKLCSKMFNFTTIAQQLNLSVTTTIRYFDMVNYPKPDKLPEVLSIDEFKGNAHGQKYQVILTDPNNGQIIDILPSRNTDDLKRYFFSFPKEIRKKVKFIVMDLSHQFRHIATSCFPKAKIVSDRYHVFRLVQWAMERVRKNEQNMLYPRHRMLKSNKRILTKNRENLSEAEIDKLIYIFQVSKNIHTAYRLKEIFNEIKKINTREKIEKHLDYWLDEVKNSGLEEFQSCLTTFTRWREAIILALIKPFSNGFTEGCNNKIKVLKRISYGIRNFKRFRNRILFINTNRSKHKKDAA